MPTEWLGREALLASGKVAEARDAFEQAAALEHAADIELGILRSQMQAGHYRQALDFAAHTAGAASAPKVCTSFSTRKTSPVLAAICTCSRNDSRFTVLSLLVRNVCGCRELLGNGMAVFTYFSALHEGCILAMAGATLSALCAYGLHQRLLSPPWRLRDASL